MADQRLWVIYGDHSKGSRSHQERKPINEQFFCDNTLLVLIKLKKKTNSDFFQIRLGPNKVVKLISKWKKQKP